MISWMPLDGSGWRKNSQHISTGWGTEFFVCIQSFNPFQSTASFAMLIFKVTNFAAAG
jgi:hypothetical protein